VKRLVVAITGASGSIYGIRLLEILQRYADVEVHLVLSRSGKRTLVAETDWTVADVEALAPHRHDNGDIGATIASGSFRTAGMIIAPCSIKTAAAVAACYADNLIARAADVTLHVGHLRMMLALAEMGAVVLPPMPAFYNRPKELDDIVNHTIARVLDRLDFPQSLVGEWQGTRRRAVSGTLGA
jgi:4-hydroxy-3-polyprenylbenzoate decarboxylase